jgi:competence protein ComEC
MASPLVWIALAYISGIALAALTGESPAAAWVWTGLSAAACAAAAFKTAAGGRQGARFALRLALGLLCAGLGALNYSLVQAPGRHVEQLEGIFAERTGTVAEYPRESGGRLRATVALAPAEEPGTDPVWQSQKKALLVLNGDEDAALKLCPGDRIRFRGKLTIPERARNPGAFDYRQYLKYQAIFCLVEGAVEDVQILKSAGGIRRLAYTARERLLSWIEAELPPEEGAILAGFLLGDTSAMSDEDLADYRRAGIAHLFAVSGTHVGLFLGMILMAGSFFKWNVWVRFGFTVLCLAGYGFLTGWGASVTRAVIMALLALLASALGRKANALINISLAAWIILIIRPGQLFTAGFQLSFGVTLGMLRLSPWLETLGLKKHWAAPLAAQLAGLPLNSFWFNQITPLGVVVNLAAMAMAGPVLTLMIISGILNILLPSLALPLLWAAGAAAWVLRGMTLFWAGLPWAAWPVAAPDWPWVLAAGIGLWTLPELKRYIYALRAWALFRFGEKAAVRLLAAALAGICLPAVCAGLFFPGKGRLEVIFLDVGEGDCIFLQTPGGKRWLVDGGGTPAGDYPVGIKTVLPFLTYRGVRKLDGMIMTHPHLDHMEGLMELMGEIRTDVFLTQPAEGSLEEGRILSAAAARGIPSRALAAGDRWELDKGVVMEVLYPKKDTEMTENDRSLILRLSSGDAAWLLTGDAENPALELLLAEGKPLRSAVLKLAHHGSRTSFLPEFYEAVAPGVAVSPGGSRSHPHAEVREWFEARDIPLYATRERGAVSTYWDGRRIWVECCV